ncbi:cation:proton antiporter [Crateriforma spongiae]|uniref:cation:proton antiporter n=1 Tax=Crateriforma spongiae TaxID=2724528 RepID=UPI0014487E4C|nr:cation:proton antiporter [Crateriforma spongiae]
MNGVPDAVSLIILGGFLLAGFAADVLGRRIYVPRVTLLLLLGFLAGPQVWRLVPDEISQWFSFATLLALSILGFHLGERFLGKRLRTTGKSVAFVSLAEVTMSAACSQWGMELSRVRYGSRGPREFRACCAYLINHPARRRDQSVGIGIAP